VKICQVAKTGLFPSDVEALGELGLDIASAADWCRAVPYKSSLTGVTGDALCDGYEAQSGKQWTHQLGATLSLFDAGFAALAAASDPSIKEAVATPAATLKTLASAGKVDFTAGPMPHVSPGPTVGTRWLRARAGGSFTFDYVVTENATDPNVPVARSLTRYHG